MVVVATVLGQGVDGNKMQLSSHALSLSIMQFLIDVQKMCKRKSGGKKEQE